MLDKIQQPMTPEEFYAWQEGMDEKYELVDSYPVPRCPDIEMMMSGVSRGELGSGSPGGDDRRCHRQA